MSRELKESGIAYIISDNGIQLADKITTVNESQYPLLDAHFLDWNSSYLYYLQKIPKKLFQKFAYSEAVPTNIDRFEELSWYKDERKRYEADKYFENVAKAATVEGKHSYILPPTWYAEGEHASYISNSTELLDVIDFLTFSTTYCFNLIDNLYTIQGEVNPFLKFDYSNKEYGIKWYGGGEPDSDFNIRYDQRITFTLMPNQCNPRFSEYFRTHYPGDNIMGRVYPSSDGFGRNMKMFIRVTDAYGNPITNPRFFLGGDGSSCLLQSNAGLSIEPVHSELTDFVDIFKNASISINAGQDAPEGSFTINISMPKSQIVNWDNTKYDDQTLRFQFFTLPLYAGDKESEHYAKSNTLWMYVTFQKDINEFEYVYIDNQRYFILDEHFFDNYVDDVFNDIDANIKGHKFLIAQKIVNDMGRMSPAEIIEEDFLDINEEDNTKTLKNNVLISAENDPKYPFFVKNEKETVFEIYPKYFGKSIYADDEDETSSAIYCGIQDSELLDLDVDITDEDGELVLEKIKSNLLEYVVLEHYSKASATPNITNIPTFYNEGNEILLTNKVINGINRTGFQTKIKIVQDITSDVDAVNKKPRHTSIKLGIKSTHFTGRTDIQLYIQCTDTLNIKVIDMNKEFLNETASYSGNDLEAYGPYGGKTTVSNYMKQIKGLIYSKLYSTETTHNLAIRIPLFESHSWKPASMTKLQRSVLYDYNGMNKLPIPDSDNVGECFNNAMKGYIDDAHPTQNFSTTFMKYCPTRYTNGLKSIFIGANFKEDIENHNNGINVQPLIRACVDPITNRGNKKQMNGWLDVTQHIEIDFVKTLKLNKEFILNCSDNTEFFNYIDIENIDSKTNDEVETIAKNFCSRYCALYKDRDLGTEIKNRKYLLLYRPTIPDNLLNTDFESKFNQLDANGIPTSNIVFKLALKINAGSQIVNSKQYVYDETNLVIYLMVERADKEFAGWAGKSADNWGNAALLKSIKFTEHIPLSELVSSKEFTPTSKFTIQTLNTNLYVPKSDKVITYEGVNYNEEKIINNIFSTDAGDSTQTSYIYYIVRDNCTNHKDVEEVVFYTTPGQPSNKYIYTIDNNSTLEIKNGTINGDEFFKGFNPIYPISVSREVPNYIVSPKNVDRDVFNLTTISTQLQSFLGIKNGEAAKYSLNLTNKAEIVNLLDNCFSIDSTKWHEVYGDKSIKDVVQISLTTQISSDYNDSSISNITFSNIWDKSLNNISQIANIITGAKDIDDTSNDKCNFPTSDGFNCFYTDDENVKNTGNANYINKIIDDDKIGFQLVTGNLNAFTWATMLRVRAIVVFPMTDKYRGYIVDIRLNIPLP